MCDRCSEAYSTAIVLGLLDEIVTSFVDELHKFKEPYRVSKVAYNLVRLQGKS
jgi:hypothetical protein